MTIFKVNKQLAYNTLYLFSLPKLENSTFLFLKFYTYYERKKYNKLLKNVNMNLQSNLGRLTTMTIETNKIQETASFNIS